MTVLEAQPHVVRAPLAVTLCTTCGLSQLTVVVDPEVLYSGYKFRSGASAQWRTHCERLADRAGKPGRMLDIAANDGTCMRAFMSRGWLVVGVDPSPADDGIIKGFWPINLPDTYDFIVAQNVLGHVDRPVEFLQAAEAVLAPDGLIVVEVPHVRDMLWNCAFDTIYHEHLSYWSTRAIVRAAKQANLILHDSERLAEVHGGSRRFWFRKGKSDASEHPVYELRMLDLPYHKFAIDVDRRLAHVRRELDKMAAEGLVIGAYGASAKGTVMLNALKSRGNTVWPCAIVDDVKEKQGMLSPGLHIPIKAPEDAGMCEWDVCWILSWNAAEELKRRARENGFTGEYLITTPQVCRST